MIDRRAIPIGLAAIAAFLELYATQALLPLLVEEFQATPAEVSHTVGATTFAVALIAPFTGAAADVLGRKRIIVAAMFAVVVPTLLAAAAPNLGVLILWRFVQGLMLPPIFAVTVAYIGEEFAPAEATTMTGFYMAASGIGGFASRFVSALVAEHFGWRAAFLALAAISVLCAIGVAALLPPERRFLRKSGLLASGRAMLRHLGNPGLLATYGVGFGVLFCFVGVFTYINFLLAAPPFGLSTAALGGIFAVYLIGVVFAPATGALVARLGRRLLVAIACALWILGLALTLAGNLWVILGGLAVCVSSGFVCQSCATSYVAVMARDARSSAVGLYVSIYYVGGGAGAVITGWSWSLARWPACAATAAIMVALIAAIAWRFWRDPAPRPPDALPG